MADKLVILQKRYANLSAFMSSKTGVRMQYKINIVNKGPFAKKQKVCECGADKCGLLTHDSYCDKYERSV